MESAQSRPRLTTSSKGSEPSTPQYRAIYATERAKILFGGYRRGDANDPDTYVASIAAVLAMYDPEIIAQVTDPRTGISTHERFRTFMPNSGELKAYCDEQQAIRDRHRRYAALPRPNFQRLQIEGEKPQRNLANLFVPADSPNYQAMKDWAEKADPRYWHADPAGRPGIWVPFWIFGEARRRVSNSKLETFRRLTKDELIALYGRDPRAAE